MASKHLGRDQSGPHGEGSQLKSVTKINDIVSLWSDPILEFSDYVLTTFFIAVAM